MQATNTVECCIEVRMRQSMSRADNCYDNAFMESCFATVKTELEMECYENERDARKEIGGYLRYYSLSAHLGLNFRDFFCGAAC